MTDETKGPEGQGQPELDEKLLKIRHLLPVDFVTNFSNHMVVQHNEHEFCLTFFNILQPLLPTDDAERATAVKKLESVPAVPVARVAIPATRIKSFADALMKNVDKYEKLVGALPPAAVDDGDDSPPAAGTNGAKR